MTRYHLTFDIDWAPDWSVREVLAILAEHERRATFFVTHASPVLAEIQAAGHEVGIHPNFLPGSTQGSDPASIVGELLRLCPGARVMRTHGLIQGSLLFRDVLRAHPGIRYDLSVLTYRARHVEWTNWHLDGTEMSRLNYTWEDDFAFSDLTFDWARFEPEGELAVLDFHPIHVSMNARDAGPYEAVKRGLAGRPLTELERDPTLKAVETRPGTRDQLLAVLRSRAQALTFEELT